VAAGSVANRRYPSPARRQLNDPKQPPSMGLPRPPGSPITLQAAGLVAYLARVPRKRIHPAVRTKLLQGITSPLTLADDLGIRRSA
jgi:hypothetical protein